MSETKSFTVDGYSYEYNPLKTKASLKLLNRLVRTIGPAVAKLTESAGSLESIVDVLRSLDDDTLEHLIATFGAQCTYTDKSGNYLMSKAFDAHFQGRLMASLGWLANCASSEYASFLADLGTLTNVPLAPAR